MHYGTCVTHVPWCMSGSLTRSGRENVRSIPGDMRIPQFYVSGKKPMRTNTLNTWFIYTNFLYTQPDITCLHLPTWEGVVVSSYNNHVGAEVNITCEEEYVLDENSSTSLSCLTNGAWYPDFPKCKCELSPISTTTSSARGILGLMQCDAISFYTFVLSSYLWMLNICFGGSKTAFLQFCVFNTLRRRQSGYNFSRIHFQMYFTV